MLVHATFIFGQLYVFTSFFFSCLIKINTFENMNTKGNIKINRSIVGRRNTGKKDTCWHNKHSIPLHARGFCSRCGGTWSAGQQACTHADDGVNFMPDCA